MYKHNTCFRSKILIIAFYIINLIQHVKRSLIVTYNEKAIIYLLY